MTSLDLVQLAIGTMVSLNILTLALTLGVKSAVSAKVSWFDRNVRRIEPAIERYLLTGDHQPDLDSLRSWQVNLFVSPRIVERMTLVRGATRDPGRLASGGLNGRRCRPARHVNRAPARAGTTR